MANIAQSKGREFEGTIAYLIEAQGAKFIKGKPHLRLVEEMNAGLRLFSQVECEAISENGSGRGVEKVRLDFVLEADVGSYNPAMFPGHDPTLRLSMAIEVKQQEVNGSVDDKLVGAYLKLTKTKRKFTHKLLITHVPGAGRGAINDLEAIFCDQGLERDDDCSYTVMKPKPARFQWIDQEVFLDWLPYAFPVTGRILPTWEAPTVFRS
jgi:hypothetical protein